MKNNYQNILGAAAIVAGLSGATAIAGTEMTVAPPIEMPAADVVSGSLNFDFNSHFMSYGLDIWADGVSNSDFAFNPSAELAFALPYGLTSTVGVWLDVNDKVIDNPRQEFTNRETDIWFGLSKDFGKWTVGATYQYWFYGDDAEEILDFSIAYDTFLSPSLTIHNRVEEGAAVGANFDAVTNPTSTGATGTIFVFGVSHSVEAGPVTFNFPANVAIFATEGFHGDNDLGQNLDSGYGYFSVGVNASIPLTPYIGEAYGNWDFHAGVDFFFTEDDVIGNENNDPFNVNFGLGCTF